MKQVLILFVVGVFFAFVGVVMLNSSDLSPLNLEMLQELADAKEIQSNEWGRLNEEIKNLIDRGLIISYLTPNAYILMASFLLSIFFIFIAIHLVIEKFLFKKFFEKPSLWNAIRRGIILCLAIAVSTYLKVYRIDSIFIILVPFAALLIEFLYYFYIKKGDVVEMMEEVENIEFPISN